MVTPRIASRMTASVIAAAAIALCSVPAFAGTVQDAASEALSQKLFPSFDAIGRDGAALGRLRARPEVSAMLGARQDRRAACAEDLPCIAQAMVWSQAEIATLADAAPALSGAKLADDGPAAQVRRELVGVNEILRTYALGHVSRYPKIDGSGTLDPEERLSRLAAAHWMTQTTSRAGSTQALDPSIEYALTLLDVSDRTDAIGFDPLTGGLNAPAMKRAKGIDWKRYRYSAMIVTGVGPEMPDMALSPLGKYHLRLAAERFAQGDVPFIIVSGGRAHPRATRFTEAEEMRAALIERYGIPADAIVIEPYARHTTTNMRNATRLVMAMAGPLDKDMLIICNPRQSAMIENSLFEQRNIDELGYLPGKVGRRISPTELEYRPSPLSARIDPRDPLDP